MFSVYTCYTMGLRENKFFIVLYPPTQLLAIHHKRGQKQILDHAILEKTDTRLRNLREN